MTAPGCPRCAGAVALHEGRPSVTLGGHVALWHRDCWELRDVPLVGEAGAALSAPRVKRSWRGAGAWARRAAGLAAVAGAVVAGTALAASAWPIAADTAPPLAIAAREPLLIRGAMPAHDDAPPRAHRFVKPIEDADEVPLLDGKPLDELYPSLKDWVHPVTASAEYMPTFPPRLFGAERQGVARSECGAGHCGVDLDGPKGRPIVAVAAGIVVHAERREKGGDGRSGRYVRIRHEDGTFTAYMHMDEVAEGLEAGSVVARGQYIGTLGATAVYAAPPHLHFSLEIPNTEARDARGDHTATRYVNPAPFLMRSTIAPVIERPSRPALN
jgi:murein DD-endopeptidase MepM/ murein hydrolase activator NlpD